MGLCFLPICNCDPVRSYLLLCSKQNYIYSMHLFYRVKLCNMISTALLNVLNYMFLRGGEGVVELVSSHSCCNMQLNVNAILSVLLSSFTGFGLAISTNSLIVEYLRWRTSRQMQSPHWQVNIVQQQEQQNQQSQQQEYQHHQHQSHHRHQQQLTETASVGPMIVPGSD